MPVSTDAQGRLAIGGVTASELAREFGTPLYAYDVGVIRANIRAYRAAFAAHQVDYTVSYAAKAFATIAMFQVAVSEGAHLDVVSGGEIVTAQRAGVNMAHVSFNGNNKSDAELQLALDAGLGTIIVDNRFELNRLEELAAARHVVQDILLRIAPDVSAHTHEYIMTGQADSKFGFDVASGQAHDALIAAQAAPHLNLLGLHAHIGSQIFAVDGFVAEAQKLVDLVRAWDYAPQVLDLGGGFGIQYTDADTPIPPTEFVDALVSTIQTGLADTNWTLPAIWIEPGRSIVGAAGITLYTAGGTKQIPGVRTYQTVDGGMGDNIRPALYQAEYEAVLADRPHAATTQVVTLAGKYCESGDILVERAALPPVVPGDILAVLATGAYGYSMASHYNRNPLPAVVFCEDGQAQVVVRRETWADLVAFDEPYQHD
ncbi:diaminopimelate decarboxylase [Lacticaseibacillus thailandensis]|uniref:diaminopimelate decarboxylase n=1 Tax=Lacticaseibacillus thailandensis TaxID=381741 RepID=UPI0012E143D4|nr:diaminopimelate decarboxylase [Lacticaseibacillus thailandensis]